MGGDAAPYPWSNVTHSARSSGVHAWPSPHRTQLELDAEKTPSAAGWQISRKPARNASS